MALCEFEDKLQSVLGDPNAMEQIIALARSLTENRTPQNTDCTAEGFSSDSYTEVPENGEPHTLLDGIDPQLLKLGTRLLSEYNRKDDRTVALLLALQPFLRQERNIKVEKAIQIARLSRLIRIGLDSFRKGDADFV